MYDLDPVFDVEVDPGTNILLSGPPLSGKRSLAMQILAAGTANGEGAIVVSTKDDADRTLESYRDHVDVQGRPVAVVDCVTRQRGVNDASEEEWIKYASSPVDMTGIGINFSELLQSFYEERGVERNRILLHSLSTLLMYSDLQTVFRFLHVFTGRIQSVNGLGLFTIDESAHEDRELNTLKQLFDGIITTHEDGEPTLRLAE
jgi:KaiC/GvpD/RAD55 family RecA-like ATPase